MKNRIRILVGILALLFLISSFVACGGGDETGRAGTEKETESGTEVDARSAVADTVPDGLDYGEDEVTFFVRNDWPMWEYEMACEELLNDTLYDAIHYRNIDVETRLNVRIRTVAQAGEYSYRDQWRHTLSSSVLNNQHDYDGTAMYLSVGSALAKDNIFYNLMQLQEGYGVGHLNFEKPWWNQRMADELTVYGALFFAAGDLLITDVAEGADVMFNKDLFNEKYPEKGVDSLYAAVRAGEWTIDLMTEYASGVWDDLNANGVMDDGDVAGIFGVRQNASERDAWIPALGLKLTQMNKYGEPEFALFNSQTIPAYEKLKKLFIENSGALVAFTYGEVTGTTMANGNLLFNTAKLSTGDALRDSLVNYGILPLPKYDAEQDAYRTAFYNVASALALCSNLSDERAAQVSAVVEALAAQSYKTVIPTYYSKVLKGQYSKDEPDAEMYDIILGSFDFSFGYAYSTESLGGFGSLFRDMRETDDPQRTIDANRSLYEKKLADLLSALEKIS